MDRRCFLLTSVAGALAVPLAAGAQRAGKVYTIGVLSASSPATIDDVDKAMRDALTQLGYLEKRNIVIDRRRESEDSR